MLAYAEGGYVGPEFGDDARELVAEGYGEGGVG